LLGLREPGEDEIAVTDRLTLTNTATGEPEIRIVDGGTRASVSGDEDRLDVVVLRGPCYVALRSLVCSGYRQPDGIVLLSEPGRSLTDRDVHDVTGIPVVATVAVTPAVARTIDAGLLIGRLHRLRDLAPLRRYTAGLLNFPPRRDPTSGLLAPALPPAADLNESPFRTPVNIGTDLPVALSATG
jgi:hypothetical protein